MTEELKQAAQMALDLLSSLPWNDGYEDATANTINALRAAISQAQGGKTGEAVGTVCGDERAYHRSHLTVSLDRFVKPGTKLYAHPAPGVPEGWRAAVQRLVDGFEHVSGIARLWEPDHSSGPDRAKWARATEACADVARMLAAAPAQKRADHG